MSLMRVRPWPHFVACGRPDSIYRTVVSRQLYYAGVAKVALAQETAAGGGIWRPAQDKHNEYI